MLIFTLLTLAPSIVVMMTPFTRIVIVLGLLRNALGTQQSPPNTVLMGLALFVNLAKLDVEKTTVDKVTMTVIIPAFMVSELRSSFQIGFVSYLLFLVVDMVVSSILMGTCMLMLPPVLISLPFKLLMFILSDGWNLIFGSLVRSFKI